MEPIGTLNETETVREAAKLLLSRRGDILAVVSTTGNLTRVITD
jgi:CBS domain-containing protein